MIIKDIFKKLKEKNGYLISNERDGFAYEFECYDDDISLMSLDHDATINFDAKWEDVNIKGSQVEIKGVDDWGYKIHMEFTMVIPFTNEN